MTEPSTPSYRFDPDDLDLDEADDLQEVTGKSLGEITAEYLGCGICGKPHGNERCGECGRVHEAQKVGAKGKPLRPVKYDHEWRSPYDHDRIPPLRSQTLRAIAWILERRKNPAFTLEDAGRTTIRQMFAPVEAAPKDAAASTGT
jgi:hypothetical protein